MSTQFKQNDSSLENCDLKTENIIETNPLLFLKREYIRLMDINGSTTSSCISGSSGTSQSDYGPDDN